MTDLQAQDFMNLLKKYYPSYDVPDEEYATWLMKLRYYDFYKAKEVLVEFIFARTQITNKPPNGKIISMLQSRASILKENQVSKSGPILVYEICKLGNDRGMTFVMDRLPASPEVVENAAARDFEKLKNKYGCDMYPIRHWESLYEPSHNQENEIVGAEAFDLFVANTLNLPACHGRRIWLEEYLKKTRANEFALNENWLNMKSVPAGKLVNVNNERNRQMELLSK